MTLNRALFASESEEWATPIALFRTLDAEFSFTLDPCASHENAKVTNYFTRSDDGLAQAWWGRVFVNPPYGRQVGRWLDKAYQESRQGVTLVCLIAARCDTKSWHSIVMRSDEIRFIRGRLQFEHVRRQERLGQDNAPRNTAPFRRASWSSVRAASGPTVSSIRRDGVPVDAVDELVVEHSPLERRRAG